MELSEEILSVMIGKASNLFQRDPDELSKETRFVEDLDAESVNYVQIIAVIEEEFGIDINFMDFRRQPSFGKATEYVVSLM